MASFCEEITNEFRPLDNSIPTEDVCHNIAIVTGTVENLRGRVSKVLHDHIDKTDEIAHRLARSAHLPAILRNMLSLVAKGHDLGKSCFPGLIERYPFESDERTTYRGHVQRSVEMLNGLRGRHGDIIKQAIADHHERPNGSGYPHQKTGTELSHLTVLFIIIDVFATIVWPPPQSHHAVRNPADRLKHFFSELIKGSADAEFDRGAGEMFLCVFNDGAFDDMVIPWEDRSFPIGELRGVSS